MIDKAMTPEERFIERQLRSRKGRPWGALDPQPMLLRTDNPLGNPKEKRDPSRYELVEKILRTGAYSRIQEDPENTNQGLLQLVSRFDPTWADLEQLQNTVFSEFEDLKLLLATVDPFRLPTMDQNMRILEFDDPALTAEERGALGEHTLAGAVDYVDDGFKDVRLEDGTTISVPAKKRYFVDRNIVRAYQQFYTPWIVFWLYGFAASVAPRDYLVNWSPKERVSHAIELMGVRAKNKGWPVDLSAIEKMAVLYSHRLFVEDSIWFSVFNSRPTARFAKPSSAIRAVLEDLAKLAREFDGRRVSLDPATVKLLQGKDVPRGVVRALVELTDPDLYVEGQKDKAVLERLDGITDLVATAWRNYQDKPAVQTHIAGILMDTPNVQNQFRSGYYKSKKRMPKGFDQSIEKEEIEAEIHRAYLLALENWDSATKDVSFSQYLAGCLKLHVKSTAIDEEWSKVDQVPLVDEREDPVTSGKFAPTEYEDERANRPVDAIIEVDAREKRIAEQLPKFTRKETAVYSAWRKHMEAGESDGDARKLAATDLDMSDASFRQHLKNLRKKLREAP